MSKFSKLIIWLGDSAEAYQLGFQDPATTTMEGTYLFNLHLLFIIIAVCAKVEQELRNGKLENFSIFGFTLFLALTILIPFMLLIPSGISEYFILCYNTMIVIIILPSMGIISHIIFQKSKKILFKKFTIRNLSVIGLLGHSNWLLYTLNVYFNPNILAVIIRIMVVLAIFLLLMNLCFSLYKSKVELEIYFLFIIGYIVEMFWSFCIIFFLYITKLEINQFIYLLYYLLANIVFFSLLAGFYFCFPQIFGFYYSGFLAQLHFWFFFIGSNLINFPCFFANMAMFQSRNCNSDWDTFMDRLNLASEVGFYFLLVSLFLFLIVIIETLVKKRTSKNLILPIVEVKNVTNKLDFLIAISFLIYFFIFFLLSFINQIYWVLVIYGGFFLTCVVLTMLPKAKVTAYYFSPLKETSAALHWGYKSNWPFFYYVVQFIKIFFIGLNLYIVFFLDITLKDLYGDLNFPFYIEQFEHSNLMVSYRILSPIFFILLVTEMFLKLYQLWLLFLTENSKITQKIDSAKIKSRQFSTVALLPLTLTQRKIYWVYFSLSGAIVVSTIGFVKFWYLDIPNTLAPYRIINHTWI